MKKSKAGKSSRNKLFKQTISRVLLGVLEGSAFTTSELARSVDAMFVSGRSTKRYYQALNGQLPSTQNYLFRDWKEQRVAYKRYHALLSRLREQGLLEEEKNGTTGKRWRISRAGHFLLADERKRVSSIEAYARDGGVTVVSYDIPEKQRKERDSLRETLQMVGFEQAHRSVWFANKRVTAQFLAFLREHKIAACVHIFEITKTGTLKKKEVTE